MAKDKKPKGTTLNDVAYRFELVELQRRVEILEKRIGAKK